MSYSVYIYIMFLAKFLKQFNFFILKEKFLNYTSVPKNDI